jgi:predicted metal-dependent TIM-barrel fold hydrolase
MLLLKEKKADVIIHHVKNVTNLEKFNIRDYATRENIASGVHSVKYFSI